MIIILLPHFLFRLFPIFHSSDSDTLPSHPAYSDCSQFPTPTPLSLSPGCVSIYPLHPIMSLPVSLRCRCLTITLSSYESCSILIWLFCSGTDTHILPPSSRLHLTICLFFLFPHFFFLSALKISQKSINIVCTNSEYFKTRTQTLLNGLQCVQNVCKILQIVISPPKHFVV